MGGTTPNLGLPYPSPPDPADVPSDIEALAQMLDTLLSGSDELGYDQIVATVAPSGTTPATATTVIQSPARTFDGGAILVEFFSPFVISPSAAATGINLGLFDGATMVTVLAMVLAPSGSIRVPVLARQRLTPSAGSHTYKVAAWSSNPASSQVGAGPGSGGGNAPAYLRYLRASS